MKEYDGLTPEESERYEELLRTAYPQPSPDMKEKVMAKIAAERARRNRRSQFIMKCGSLAACLVIISVVAIKALPLLSDKKLAEDANDVKFFSDNSAVCYNLALPEDSGCDAPAQTNGDPLLGASMKTDGIDSADMEPVYGGYTESRNIVTPAEAVDAYNYAYIALNSNTSVAEDDALEREYRPEVYSIEYLTTSYADEEAPVSQDELQSWTTAKQLTIADADQGTTPILYQAVHELGVSKETLIELNDSRKAREDGGELVLPDEVIDALYLDEDEMKLALASSLALNYDGKIYSFNDISLMSAEQALCDGIPPEVLVEYVEKVINYCIENGFITEDALEEAIQEIIEKVG